MNKILTTSVSDPTIGQPLTAKSLEFLQNANKEISLGFAQAMVGESYDVTKAYVLKGLDAYGTNQYREGWLLWNGEVYYSAGKASTTAFSNVAVMTITVTNDATADPLTFTDLVVRNVHNVRRLVLSDAVSGTGTFDLSDAIYIQEWIYIDPTTLVLEGYDHATLEVTTAPTATININPYFSLTGNVDSYFKYKRSGKAIIIDYAFQFTWLTTTNPVTRFVLTLPAPLDSISGFSTSLYSCWHNSASNLPAGVFQMFATADYLQFHPVLTVTARNTNGFFNDVYDYTGIAAGAITTTPTGATGNVTHVFSGQIIIETV